MESSTSNLHNMGLNEVAILDAIFINIHPVYLVPMRSICKLFKERIDSMIPNLYQKWVINLPLNIIHKDTKKWKLKHLIKCSLIMFPTPKSHKLRNNIQVIINSIITQCNEDMCISLFENMFFRKGKGLRTAPIYFIMMNHDLIYLSWKYGYHKLRERYSDAMSKTNFLGNNQFTFINRIYEAYFNKTSIDEYSSLPNNDNLLLVDALESKYIDMNEYCSIVELCLPVLDKSLFVQGLEDQTYNVNGHGCYTYSSGYFLGSYLERSKLTKFLARNKIQVTIPINKEPYKIVNNKVPYQYKEEEEL